MEKMDLKSESKLEEFQLMKIIQEMYFWTRKMFQFMH